jgi:uncharacterized protein
LNKGSKVGQLVYPDNATWPEVEHMVRWFDHWLKDVPNGIEREPAVRYYVMGAVGEEGAPGNVWREAADWPPAVEKTAFFPPSWSGASAAAPTAPRRAAPAMKAIR